MGNARSIIAFLSLTSTHNLKQAKQVCKFLIQPAKRIHSVSGVRAFGSERSFIESISSEHRINECILIQLTECHSVGANIPVPKYRYKLIHLLTIILLYLSNITVSFRFADDRGFDSQERSFASNHCCGGVI